MIYDLSGNAILEYPEIVGDGIVDDTDALQEVVNKGGAIRLPDKLKVKLTQTITIDPAVCTLFDGGNSTFIVSGDFPAFTISGSLVSPMTASPATLTSKIIEKEAGFRLANCRITSSSSTTGTGILIDGVFKAKISGCYIYKLKNGIHIKNQCRDLIVAKNNIYACASYGLYLDNTLNLHQCNIIGNLISYCYYCVYINDPVQIANLQIVGNDIEISDYPTGSSTNFRALVISSGNTNAGQLSEIEITGNTIQGHSSSSGVIVISGGSNRNVMLVSVVGNHISNSTANLIDLTRVRCASFCGNTYKDATGAIFTLDTCDRITIVGESAINVGGLSTASGSTNIITDNNNIGAA